MVYMGWIFDKSYKNRIGQQLVSCIGTAIESGELEVDDLSNVCDSILVVIDTIKTQEELSTFLEKLSGSWPFFNMVLTKENKIGESIQTIEQKFSQRDNKAHP